MTSAQKGAPGSWWNKVARWPRELYRYWSGKRAGWWLSARLRRTAQRLQLPDKQSLGHLADAWQSLGSKTYRPELELKAAERALLSDIRQRTERENRNNVTRTAAYLSFYRRHPEVHWSLLAHMVSRNGGWNMTDLQGELISRLLSGEQRRQTFQMLERANFLIFGDAYPQLLLYEAGLATGEDLSRLLPALGVSRFMQPVWSRFYASRESAMLSMALIVNEQHYIEERVVQHPWYREHVLEALYFKLQSPLQFNQVIFPYQANGQGTVYVGLVLEDFTSLQERIAFGKRLYAILYRIPEVFDGVSGYVCHHPHTGSRADYAGELFSPEAGAQAHGPFRERLHALRLLEGADRLYSPELGQAWADQPGRPPEPGDWLMQADPQDLAGYLERLPLPRSFVITNEYGFALDKLELAVLAGEDTHTLPGRRD
ncbi:DUF2515 family protein [Paenibacillus daejeonensis]|uniref:DUF2515 family protein n=1 Tax=Paenibacillus daejeonensis TaxID=135193 RepID=UPI0003823715|nr:DUF2515 family protein [Paenibacillus daejeonensis]